MQQILLVGIGGSLGALARMLTTKYASGYWGAFPIGTLIVNVIGSFLLGIVMYSFLQESRLISPEFRTFAAIGFLGAFTTMSTFAFETVRFAEQKNFSMFGLNLGLNIFLSIMAIYLGRVVALYFIGNK